MKVWKVLMLIGPDYCLIISSPSAWNFCSMLHATCRSSQNELVGEICLARKKTARLHLVFDFSCAGAGLTGRTGWHWPNHILHDDLPICTQAGLQPAGESFALSLAAVCVEGFSSCRLGWAERKPYTPCNFIVE